MEVGPLWQVLEVFNYLCILPYAKSRDSKKVKIVAMQTAFDNIVVTEMG